MTCNTTVQQTLEGGAQCGEVNGEWRCIKPSPTPTSTAVDTEEQVTKEDQAGGGEKTTTTTTTTKTYCQEGACTTTNTTNTNVTVTGPGGETISETDNCFGAGCGKPEQPDEQQEEEEEVEPEATGLACAESLACTGDAVQAAAAAEFLGGDKKAPAMTKAQYLAHQKPRVARPAADRA